MLRLITVSFCHIIAFTLSSFAGSREISSARLFDSANALALRKDILHSKILIKQAVGICEQNHDTTQLLNGLLMLEKIYTENGQNDSAITICYKRLAINRLKKNYINLSDNFRALNTLLITNIGAHASGGLLDSCLHCALLSKDSRTIAIAYTNYGLYVSEKDKPSGLKYLTDAVEQSNSIPNETIYLYARVQAAEILISMDSLAKAKEYLQDALSKAVKTNEKIQRAHVYLALGRISLKEERVREAIAQFQNARVISEAGPYTYYLPDIYQNLSQAFRRLGVVDSSFYYKDKAVSVQLLLVNERTNQQVAEVNAKYQLDGKEATIKKLGSKIDSFKRWLMIMITGAIAVIAFFVAYFLRIKKASEPIPGKYQPAKGAKRIPMLPLTFRKEFEKVFVKEELYTQNDLTLQKVADLLKTNTTYLSRFINEEYKTNFSQLLNQYRIEKSCLLLLDDKMDNLTIEAIAQAAGFNSKSTFNSAFRSLKGVTPTQWRDKNKPL